MRMFKQGGGEEEGAATREHAAAERMRQTAGGGARAAAAAAAVERDQNARKAPRTEPAHHDEPTVSNALCLYLFSRQRRAKRGAQNKSTDPEKSCRACCCRSDSNALTDLAGGSDRARGVMILKQTFEVFLDCRCRGARCPFLQGVETDRAGRRCARGATRACSARGDA